MKCISFGKIDKKLLIPVVGGLTTLIYKYIVKNNPKYKILTQNPFLVSIYVAFGMILAIIPHLILKNRSKKDSNNQRKLIEHSKLNIELIVDDYDIFDRTKFAKFRFIFYSTVFDFAQSLLYSLFALNNSFNLWNFDILLFSLFSYLMLKTKLYRHQYISMIIIIILGFGLNITEAYKDDTENTSGAFEIIMIFISEICFSFGIVIIKYNMEKNYCNPYEICIWEGAIGFIINLICLIAFNLSALTIDGIKYPDNIIEYVENFNYNDFIVCFTITIAHFFVNTSLLLTCHYFTPTHTLIIFIIKDCHLYLRSSENVFLNISGFLILILIALSFLIFIEIIEINICNISYNTKKNIEIRSRKESSNDFIALLPSNEEEEEEEKEDEDNKDENMFPLVSN